MKTISTLLAIGLLVASNIARSHHSGAVFFDGDARIEISGVVTETHWRNPHAAFQIMVTDENGDQQEWTVESNALNTLERQGVSPETFKVGDAVRFWGPPARRSENHMRAYNVLLADNTEVVLWKRNPPEHPWADAELVDSVAEIDTRNADEYIAKADGIFRTWSPGRIKTLNESLPLNEEAQAAKAAYNPLTDDPVLDCIPTGMPAVMDVSLPIEFSKQGENILLRLEQWDTERVIHLNAEEAESDLLATREGYSVGRWEGSTLVVETSHIKADYFDDKGTPISDMVTVVERWTINEDETGLHWQATTTDPKTFTEPVIQEQVFPWVPGEEIKPYQCATTNN